MWDEIAMYRFKYLCIGIIRCIDIELCVCEHLFFYCNTNCIKSKVWQHFGFYKKDGQFYKTHAIGKIYRAATKYTRSTANLGVHLKRLHGICVETSASPMATVSG